MKACVTGAAGFLGSHLTDRLVVDGHEVLAVDVRMREESKAKIHVEDVMEPEFTELVVDFGPDVVFHMAGQNDVGASWQDPVLDAELNIVATLGAYQAARSGGAKRFVYPSTWMVYQGTAAGLLPWRVDTRPMPVTPYGASKLAAEITLKVLSNSGGWPAVRVAVLGNVYGPRDTSVVGLIAHRMMSGEQLTIDVQTSRDFVHVDDVVRALMLAGEHEGFAFERHHVATGRQVLLTKILEQLGWDSARVVKTYNPIDDAALDVTKTLDAWGWEPRIQLLPEGLNSVVESLDSLDDQAVT